MYRSREHPASARPFASLLPWYFMPASDLVMNKDGSFLRAYHVTGRDLASSSPEEQISFYDQINALLRSQNLGNGWGLWVEAFHHPSAPYPASDWPHPAPALVDAIRRAQFAQSNKLHFDTDLTWTLGYTPPPQAIQKAESYLFTDMPAGKEVSMEQRQERFYATTRDFALQLGLHFPGVQELHSDDLLTMLHQTVSLKPQRVAMPDLPLHLDHLLCDMDASFGIPFGLGFNPETHRPEYTIACVSIRDFPATLTPGILHDLDTLPFSFRYGVRWLPLNKTTALKLLSSYESKWKSRIVPMVSRFVQTFTNKVNTESHSDHAAAQALEIKEARLRLEADEVAYGYFSSAVAVWDEDPHVAMDYAVQVDALLTSLGFTCYRETLNAGSAWLSMIPGNTVHNMRRPPLPSSNVARLLPLTAPWDGPVWDAHLQGPPLLYTRTSGNQTFRLCAHVDGVGHIKIIGGSGSGKTVLLNLMNYQFLKYPGARIAGFDKDRGFEVATRCVDGRYYLLKPGESQSIGFQPYHTLDRSESERAWAAEWTERLLVLQRGSDITSGERAELWRALRALATMPEQYRTMTSLRATIQDFTLKQMLDPYTIDGAYGSLFDADKEDMEFSWWTIFETGDILTSPLVGGPAITYIFHRLEEMVTGDPIHIPMDESYRVFDDPLFMKRMRELLKEGRRRNVQLVFAMQSISDFIEHPIAPDIIDNCKTTIYLANPSATTPQMYDYYTRLGLSATQIEIIAGMTPRQHYYAVTDAGQRVFTLDLDEVQKALLASSWKEDLRQATRIADDTDGPFAAAWLRYKGISWAAEEIIGA